MGPHAFWLCKFSKNYAFLTKTKKRMFLRFLNFLLSLICLQLLLPFPLSFHLDKSSVSVGSLNLIQTIKSGSLRTEAALCDQFQVINTAFIIMYLQ